MVTRGRGGGGQSQNTRIKRVIYRIMHEWNSRDVLTPVAVSCSI